MTKADDARPSGRRSLIYLVSGTVVSQGVQFAASPFITRLYTPIDFGTFASILSIASVLSVLMLFSYHTAIPLAQSDEEARSLAWLTLVLSFTFSFLLALSLSTLVLANWTVLGYAPTWQSVFFIPVTALALALLTTLQLSSSRLGGFGRMGRATASGALGQTGSQLFLGGLGAGSAGLSAGYLAGRLLNLGVLVRGLQMGRRPRFSALASLARRYRELPRWLMPAVALNMVGTTALAPWVAHLYGVGTAGAFALAMQMLSVPAALVGTAVGTVMFPKLASLDRGTGIRAEQIEGYARALGLVALPAFLPVLMLGPELFTIVFGKQWTEAGDIAAILAPWLAVAFVSGPLSSLAVVKNRLRRVFYVAFIETSSRVAALGIGGLAGSAALGFSLYSVAGVAICLFSVGTTLYLAGADLSGLLRAKWRLIVGSILVLSMLITIRLMAPIGVIVTVTLVMTAFAALRAFKALRP